MKKYTVAAAMGLSIGPGNDITLTKDQAAARAASLEAVNAKRGHFRTLSAVQFKAGEKIGLDPNTAKAIRAKLEEQSDGDATPATAANAPAAAPAPESGGGDDNTEPPAA